MSIEHTSRTGKRYYLHVKTTKKGLPSYFFSTKPDGQRVATMPPGHEIYENFNGQVFLRKKTEPVILPEELARVERALHKQGEAWRFWVEVKDDMIVVYMDDNTDRLDNDFLSSRFRSLSEKEKRRWARYMAMLRFTLLDEKDRIFEAERFCYRSSVDDWISIGRPAALGTLLKEFVKHLGRDSFYDLF